MIRTCTHANFVIAYSNRQSDLLVLLSVVVRVCAAQYVILTVTKESRIGLCAEACSHHTSLPVLLLDFLCGLALPTLLWLLFLLDLHATIFI